MGYNWYINPLYPCFNLPFYLNSYWKLLSDFFASFTWRNIKDTLGTSSNVFLGHVKAEIFTRLKNEAFRYDSRIDISSSCNCTSGLFDYTAKRWWPSDQRSPATLPTTDLSFLIASWLGFLMLVQRIAMIHTMFSKARKALLATGNVWKRTEIFNFG